MTQLLQWLMDLLQDLALSMYLPGLPPRAEPLLMAAPHVPPH